MAQTIIISSLYLQRELSKIDFAKDRVMSVFCKGNKMTVISQEKRIEIEIEPFQSTIAITQDNRRWDWLYKMLCQIDEQPIVLDISENRLGVLISY